MPTCPKCRNEVWDDAPFCPSCGHLFESESAPVPVPQPAPVVPVSTAPETPVTAAPIVEKVSESQPTVMPPRTAQVQAPTPPKADPLTEKQPSKSKGILALMCAAAAVSCIGLICLGIFLSNTSQSSAKLETDPSLPARDSGAGSQAAPKNTPPESPTTSDEGDPKIEKLEADSPSKTDGGWNIHITWQVKNAEKVQLTAGQWHFDLDGANFGSKTVLLSEPTTVSLRALSRSGKETSWSIVAKVPSSALASEESSGSREPLASDENDPIYRLALEAISTDFARLCIDNQGSSSPDALYTEFVNLRVSELDLLRNTVCARHGYIFTKPFYREHFAKKSWYQGVTSDKHKVDADMSAMEKQNIDWFDRYAKAIKAATSNDDQLRNYPLKTESNE